MIPNALTAPKILEIFVLACTDGLCNMLDNLPSLTGTTHRSVQQLTDEMAPISDTLPREFKLGIRDKTTVPHVNTKYHSTVVNGLDMPMASHNIWTNIFKVEPPTMVKFMHVPADRSMIGNNSNQMPFCHLNSIEEQEKIHQLFFKKIFVGNCKVSLGRLSHS